MLVCQTSTIKTSTRECICGHKYTLLARDIIMLNRFYCINKQRPNSVLIYSNLVVLWNSNFNSFNFKNLRNLARHKCKTPWGWHRDVETCRSIHYTGYTQKNGAVSKVNKKFISHLTRAQRTPSAAATVQVSHAYYGAAGPVSRMASQQEKAFCVIRFKVSRSVITVQREFRARLRKEAPCMVRLFLTVHCNCTAAL